MKTVHLSLKVINNFIKNLCKRFITLNGVKWKKKKFFGSPLLIV